MKIMQNFPIDQIKEAQLEQWKKEIGPIPPYSCPKIDELIRYTRDTSLHIALEELREDNLRLRELGRFWYSKCQYIVGQLDCHGIKNLEPKLEIVLKGEINETHPRTN